MRCSIKAMHQARVKQVFSSPGITLIELAVASAIIIIAFVAFLYGLVGSLKLVQLSKETFLACQSASAVIEEIRGHNFLDTYNYYNGFAFEVAEFPIGSSKGVVTVDNSNPELLKVYIAVCWRSSDGRIIGEDVDLDGNLSASEDTNANNKLDSPVNLATFVAGH